MTARNFRTLTMRPSSVVFLILIGCLSCSESEVRTERESERVPLTERQDSTELTLLGCKAAIESHTTNLNDFAQEMRIARRREFNSNSGLENDPYPLWLTSRLFKLAFDQQLFTRDKSEAKGISLQLPVAGLGDDLFWYMVRITKSTQKGETIIILRPVFVWIYIGAVSGPEFTRDFEENFLLENVKEGDIVDFELFRISQESIEFGDLIEKRVDAETFIQDPRCQFLFRIPIPVFLL